MFQDLIDFAIYMVLKGNATCAKIGFTEINMCSSHTFHHETIESKMRAAQDFSYI